jgi:hypothetical protein
MNPRFVVRVDHVGDYVVLDTRDDLVIPFSGTNALSVVPMLNAAPGLAANYISFPAADYPPLRPL